MEYNGVSLILALWSAIIMAFGIVELVKLSGNFFHFSIGGLCALACNLLGFDFVIQVVAFAVATGLSFLVLRPLFRRMAAKNATVHEEGLDLLIGLEGKVIAKIDMDAGTGRIDINGRPVKAIPVDPQQKYNVGDLVEVTDLEGDQLVVRTARQHKR